MTAVERLLPAHPVRVRVAHTLVAPLIWDAVVVALGDILDQEVQSQGGHRVLQPLLHYQGVTAVVPIIVTYIHIYMYT